LKGPHILGEITQALALGIGEGVKQTTPLGLWRATAAERAIVDHHLSALAVKDVILFQLVIPANDVAWFFGGVLKNPAVANLFSWRWHAAFVTANKRLYRLVDHAETG